MAQPNTVLTYPLNGAKDFAIPFEYLARKFVVVSLIGTTRKTLTLNSDYRFTTRSQVTTAKVWAVADGYDTIEIRRVTSATERLVDFGDGSILRAYDLNTAQVQSLHIAEEARDLTADTIGVNNDGNLDARGRRIVNVGDALADGEAVNLRQQKAWAGSALNQAQIAQQQADISRTQADTSRNYAAQASNSAAQSASSSATSVSAAQDGSVYASRSLASASASAQSSSTAVSAAQDGSVYASRAATSASASATSATAAQQQADRAKTEADKLANFNGLAGAIDSVNAPSITWKGNVNSLPGAGSSTGFYSCNDTEANFGFANANGGDKIRFVRTGDRSVHLYDDANGERAIWTTAGMTLPRTLTVNGEVALNAGLTVAGALTAGTVTSKSGVYARTLFSVKPPSNNAENVHLWFRNTDETERALIYADSSSQLHIRTNAGSGAEAILINSANTVNIQRGLQVQHNPDVQTTFYKNGVGINGSTYGVCQLQLQAPDGSIPALGFHSAGKYAAALLLNTDNNFYTMRNNGASSVLVTGDLLGGQIGGNITAGAIGTFAFMQNLSGTALGPDSVVAGASLKYTSANATSTVTGAGSWRLHGHGNTGGVSVYCRYA